jgi:CelD/BcsL family acetyltransferase involved in cellulose biosynthesis
LEPIVTEFELTTIDKLSLSEWQAWREIQATTAVYSSPYFRPEFAQAVAAVRGDVEVAILHHAGEIAGFFPFQRGRLNLGKPLGGKLSDYHGPLLRENVPLDARELLSACRLAAWDFDHLVGPTTAFEPYTTVCAGSPQLDLSEGFAAFVQSRKEAGSDTIPRSGQKLRKLIREIGPLQFTAEADDSAAFEQLLAWKSAQYERTGLADVFAFPWTLALLKKLRQHRGAAFSAPLSVLRAGDTLVAASLSLRSHGVLHVWFNGYNPELANYSPGLLFFLQLAEQAESLGVTAIDLGRGDERYKLSLATRSVMLCEGSVTCPSLGTWLRNGWRQARDWVNDSPLKQTAALPAKLIKPVREWFAYH